MNDELQRIIDASQRVGRLQVLTYISDMHVNYIMDKNVRMSEIFGALVKELDTKFSDEGDNT